MATHRIDTFTRIYSGLREELRDARLGPGAQIRVDQTAQRYGTSATPVREALARLVGERLVVGDRSHGYYVPCLSGDAIRDLLTVNELLVMAALRARRSAQLSGELEAHMRGDSLMLAILDSADAPILTDAGRLAFERLAQMRAVEEDVLDPSGQREASDAPDQSASSGGTAGYVRRYHARRRRVAAALARVIARRAAPPREYIPDIV
jgi:DNA-binding FadR family transcriptional regulator